MNMYRIRFHWLSRRGYDIQERTVYASSEAEARLTLANRVREPIVIHEVLV